MNSKHETLKKMLRLSKEGIGGEKVNAKVMLDKLLRKYGISMAELLDMSQQREPFKFYYKSRFELSMLGNIVQQFTDNEVTQYRNIGKKGSRYVEIPLTHQEHIEIAEAYQYYRLLWHRELERFLQAFLMRHELTLESTDENPPTVSHDEIMRIYDLINGQIGESFTRQTAKKYLQKTEGSQWQR